MKKVAIKVELTNKEFEKINKVAEKSVSAYITNAVKIFLKKVEIHQPN